MKRSYVHLVLLILAGSLMFSLSVFYVESHVKTPLTYSVFLFSNSITSILFLYIVNVSVSMMREVEKLSHLWMFIMLFRLLPLLFSFFLIAAIHNSADRQFEVLIQVLHTLSAVLALGATVKSVMFIARDLGFK